MLRSAALALAARALTVAVVLGAVYLGYSKGVAPTFCFKTCTDKVSSTLAR
jgi:hypothetical protein